MKPNLLTFTGCIYCHTPLKLLSPTKTPLFDLSQSPIESGLLTCNDCSRFYPISGSVPIILPDELRNYNDDLKLLHFYSSSIDPFVLKQLKEKIESRGETSNSDSGLHFKQAEMSIQSRVDDPDFFGPGFNAPFNPGDPQYTAHLIKRFGSLLHLLDLNPGDPVLDIGCGYAWTTEWLMKMGFEPVGIDITRTYIDIGIKRMNGNLPHLVVGDVENLPLLDNTFKAVLCYDAFHHIPDRKKAMAQFARILKSDGKVVMAEPGKDHENAQVSIDVMNKYGILEIGMSLDDVTQYCQGLPFSKPIQHTICKIEKRKSFLPVFSATKYVDSFIFTITKTNENHKQKHVVTQNIISNLRFLKRMYGILIKDKP